MNMASATNYIGITVLLCIVIAPFALEVHAWLTAERQRNPVPKQGSVPPRKFKR